MSLEQAIREFPGLKEGSMLDEDDRYTWRLFNPTTWEEIPAAVFGR